MGKKVNKFTKILLLIAMIFSDLMTPIRVLASEVLETGPNSGDVGINNTVSNDNGNSITVSAGAVREEDGTLSNEGDVSVTKTVSKVKDENGNVINGRYKIEFNIKGKDVVNSTEVTKPVYVVVVFDRSGSMQNYCIGNIFGTEKEMGTAENCGTLGDYYTLYPKWKNSVVGAKSFANTLLTKIPEAQIALVTFATDSNDTPARGFENANLDNANFGTPNGGTNLHAGLDKASELLSSTSIPENANKYIVVISDGQPTYYLTSTDEVDGPGGSTSKAVLDATYAEANDIKDNKGIEVFAIGYDLPSGNVYSDSTYGTLTAKDILEDVASVDTADDINNGIHHYIGADPNAVANAFTNIATSISRNPAGTNAVLTDNIGSKFKIVGQSGRFYKEENFEITETGKTISFEVEIDKSKITSDGWYNTNDGFSLTYTDANGVQQTISTNEDPQVWWTPPVYNYTVNYYKDSFDTAPIKSEVREATNGTLINRSDIEENKYLNNTTYGTVGYEVSSVNGVPVTIDSNGKVINVLYTIKKFNYDINYYYDGVLDENLSNTVSNVNYGTEVNANLLYEAGAREGYSLDTVNSTSGIVTINGENLEINIYYKRNSYGYTVNYYFNNVIDADFTKANGNALFGSVIDAEDNYLNDNELEDKSEEDNVDYFINPILPSNPSQITIGTNANENVINIYYVSTVVTEEDIEKTADTDKITSGNTPITYNVNYTSIVKNVNKGDTVRVVITDTLPLEIDEANSELNGGVYNNSNKTITWTFEKTMTEFTERYDASQFITYTVVYKNIGNGDGSNLTNSVVGTTTAGGKTTTETGDSDTVEVEIPGEVIVHHYLKGTTTSVYEDETLNGLVGGVYTTSSKTVFGYTVDNSMMPTNASGTYTEEDIVVNYYYVKNDGTVDNTDVVKTSTDTDKLIDSINSTFGYTITATGEVRDYVGKVTVKVEDILPYALTSEAIDALSNECTYDEDSRTITCEREKTISESDYINGVYNVNEVFNLELAFVNVTEAKVTNSAKVTITLDDSKVEEEDNTTEEVTVKDGEVIVHHYVTGTTTSIYKDETLNGLVGDVYTTSSKTVFGYTVDNSMMPTNASGTYTEEDIVVTYYYVKNDGTVDNTDVVKTSTDTDKLIDSINSTFGYTITATGQVRNYVGKVTVKVEDILPYALTSEAIDALSNECTYDEDSKTITCEREKTISESDYINGVYNVNEVFNLELSFEDITEAKVVNNAKVEIILDSNVKDEDTGNEEVIVKSGTVVVTYKDNLGNELYEEVTLNGLAGVNYNTETKEFYGYTLVEVPNNKNGKYLANQTIEVNYVYAKNDGTITGNNLVKNGPSSITSIDETFDYTFKYNASVTGYTGDVTLKVTDTLPFGAVIVSMDNRCIYNKDSLTIVCQEKYTVNSDTAINEEFNVSLKYVGISFEDITVNTTLTNSLIAELIYGDNKVTNTTSKDTIVNTGTVVVIYKDTFGNDLDEEITLNGLAGEDYTTETKEFFGYTLVEVPSNKDGKYLANQTITVNYVYSKNDGIIDNTDVVKTSTDEDKVIDSVDSTFGYTIAATGEVRDYVGKVTVKVEDILPYALTEEVIDALSNECVYDEDSKTITCEREITISENDYVNGVYNVNEVFNLELSFIDVTEAKVVNNAKVEIILDSNVKDEDTGKEEVTVLDALVTVTYKDTLGNELHEDITLKGLVGNSYTTLEKEFYGYTLNKEPENASGVYTKEDITVNYVYSKNIGTSSEELVKVGLERVDDINSEFEYTITYNTTIIDYVGEATLVITDELPYEIDIEKSVYNTENCEYTEGKLVCTYTKNITKEDNTFDIEELFTLYYVDITDSKVTNKVTSELTYGETIKNNDSEYTSEVKEGTVIVNYVTTDGTKLTDSVELTGLVGESYTTDKKVFDKYNFIRVDGEVEGIYTEETKEVTYVYDLTPLPPQTGVDINPFMLVKYLVVLAIMIVTGKTYRLIKNN